MPCQAETIQAGLCLSQGTTCGLLSYAVGGGGWPSLGVGVCKYIQIVSRLCPGWVLTVGGGRGCLLLGVGQLGGLCNHKKNMKKGIKSDKS